MALNTNNLPSKGNSERVEQANLTPGTYPARIVQILDFGLQAQRPFKGEEKPPQYEIQITYELVDEFMKDKDGNELLDKPRWVSETIPIYNLKAEKAKSTMRYLAVDPNCNYDGDFSKLIALPCNVNIINNKGKDGKLYDNVDSIAGMRPRDADKCPVLVNKSRVFDLADPDLEVFKSLPKWIQEKIQSNLNYEGSVLQKLVGGAPVRKEEPQDGVVEQDNSNPF